jgi:hypothetical protein
VSGAILRALSPLFRYCSWRRAWILRGVGERFGPVLVRRDRSTARDLQLGPIRLRPGALALVSSCALGAVALGYLTGQIVSSRDRAPVPNVSYASSLSTIMGDLSAAERRNEVVLRGRQDAHRQAIAAAALASAYGQAGAALLRLQSGRAVAANAALARALRETSEAYSALALAATRADARAYPTVNAQLRQASAAVASAVERLQSAGYRLSVSASNVGN